MEKDDIPGSFLRKDMHMKKVGNTIILKLYAKSFDPEDKNMVFFSKWGKCSEEIIEETAGKIRGNHRKLLYFYTNTVEGQVVTRK